MQKSFFLTLWIYFFSQTYGVAQYEISFSDNYPPFNYINDEGELVGFNIDILKAIAELYDLNVIIKGSDWSTINREFESGQVDAIGGTHYPGTMDDDFIYSRSAINTSHCFLYNSSVNNTFSQEYFRSINRPLVAMWENDVLIHYILSINPGTQFKFITSYEELINSADMEDVTCLFGQRLGSMYFAEKMGKDYIRPLEHRILERNMGFKISRSSPELAVILNNGLEVIIANGEYQRSYKKWIAPYNETPPDLRHYLKYVLMAGGIISVLIIFLLVTNWILQSRVRKQTKDLRAQLELNSQIMKELEIEKIRAQESDRMKSAFLANMSHEIRTPMNGILGFADLLKTVDYSSEKHIKMIDIIQQSGKRMLQTINNIIDVSKLESGLESPCIDRVNIRKLMKEIENFFQPEAIRKKINFIVKEMHFSEDISFYSDDYKLNAILTNLIKNALKFTHEGFIEVCWSLQVDKLEFWVKDTGIGIPVDKQEAVFKQFVQADISPNSGFEGSGLGLSISSGYVNLLNGTISLSSEPGDGTEFYVSIPNGRGDFRVASSPDAVNAAGKTEEKN